jgi:hypothetical protein
MPMTESVAFEKMQSILSDIQDLIEKSDYDGDHVISEVQTRIEEIEG